MMTLSRPIALHNDLVLGRKVKPQNLNPKRQTDKSFTQPVLDPHSASSPSEERNSFRQCTFSFEMGSTVFCFGSSNPSFDGERTVSRMGERESTHAFQQSLPQLRAHLTS